MNRRYFFNKLASGLVTAVVAPMVFTPKLIKPAWKAGYKVTRTIKWIENPEWVKAPYVMCGFTCYVIDQPVRLVGEGWNMSPPESIVWP